MVGEIVYVGYHAGKLFHQLLVRVEHVSDSHVEVRVADEVERDHGSCFVLADAPNMNPQTVYEDPALNRILRLPVSAVLRRMQRNEEPIFVLCTPSLVGQRAKLSNCGHHEPLYGHVVRDEFRIKPGDQDCLLDLVATRTQQMRYSRFISGGKARLQTSTLTETERCNPDLLRARYLAYLRAQICEHFGGMSRHVVSGIQDGGAVAFTQGTAELPRGCYLKLDNQLVMDRVCFDAIGSEDMLDIHYAEKPRPPIKRNVIYGRPTKSSLRSPHESGRPTLQWINASEHPGLDPFIRFCLFSKEERATYDPADAIKSMLGRKGEPTVFSQLVRGYYELRRSEDNPEFAKMMETICWDFIWE